MKLKHRNYLWYKFFNSFFAGLSIGSLFTIYAPIPPSVFSVGGIVLAIGLLVIAKFYDKLLNIKRYYQISIFVEVVILFVVISFLMFSYNYMIAFLVYAGYQISFMFGNYLWRAETLIVQKKALLSFVDVSKQKGYLAGLALSFVFFEALEFFMNMSKNQDQVYVLHYILLPVEVAVIYLFIRSFKK